MVITAAWIGMIRERKTTNSSIIASPITTPMNTGSLRDVTCEKSTVEAVGPPMYTRAPVRCSYGGITSPRRRLTRSVVWLLEGALVG